MRVVIIFILLFAAGCSGDQIVDIGCPSAPGDMNYDGLITAADAAVALDISLGVIHANSCQVIAADVDQNGRIDSVDVGIIFEMALNESQTKLNFHISLRRV